QQPAGEPDGLLDVVHHQQGDEFGEFPRSRAARASSSDTNGSSRRSRSGSTANARASATRLASLLAGGSAKRLLFDVYVKPGSDASGRHVVQAAAPEMFRLSA